MKSITEDVEFRSENALLRGLIYHPKIKGDLSPVIVMAHGTSATIRMVADKYAEAFQHAGFMVLLYDHRNFGVSEGEPRQEINPWIQCRGYKDAIDYVTARPDVDSERIGLWGDSYTGGQVVVVGAVDHRVKTIVAQCPIFGENPLSLEPNEENFKKFRQVLHSGDIRGTPETTVGPLPVVSFDQIGSPSLLKPIQAYRWFIDYGGRHGTQWINHVTRVIPDTVVPYQPGLCAPFVQAPTLLMVALNDEMVHANYSVAKQAYDLIPGDKQWYDIEGGHFGLLYYPSELFKEASHIQTEFFENNL